MSFPHFQHVMNVVVKPQNYTQKNVGNHSIYIIGLSLVSRSIENAFTTITQTSGPYNGMEYTRLC